MSMDLVQHWQPIKPAGWIAGPWVDAHRHCWRCWLSYSLQRCHIVPASRGGLGEPGNLVLLCDHCHREQPNVPDPAATWAWLRATRHSGAMRVLDGWWIAYERMYSEPPLGGVAMAAGEFSGRLLEAMDAAVLHWGHQELNAATLAACVRQAEGKVG